MKNFTRHLTALAVLFLLVCGTNATKAQTTVTLTSAYDSAVTGYCNLPVQISLNGGGSTTGYNYLTDDMDIQVFWGDGNDTLFSVPLYNNVLNDYFYFYANHTYTSPGSFYVTIVATGVDGNDDTLTYGPIVISASCGIVEGYVYFDNNSNCTYDGGDASMNYTGLQVTDPASGNMVAYGYTDGTGHYSITVPTGFALEIAPVWYGPYGYSVTCPASGFQAFTSSGYNAFDFGVTCSSSQFDLASYVWAWGFVPGDTGYVYPYGINMSCVPVSGTMTLTLDPLVSYINTTWGVPPSTVSGNTLTWNFTNLSYSTGSYIWNAIWADLRVLTSTSATIGDTVCFTVTITPTVGDVNTTNNTYTYCYPVLSSWDPNMKEVSPRGIGAAGNVQPNTEFIYTVYFQNTGSAPAQNIYIMDTISNNLDMNTFEVLASSHTMNTVLFSGNIMKFEFPNINLPDSTSNEPLSHGWVRYRVKAKNGLADGTQILNTAHIFFDYNPAVVTNTTLNTIDIELGLPEAHVLNNEIYPNPASSNITIGFSQPAQGVLQVRDITGKVVYSVNVNGSNQVLLDVSQWNAGMYEVTLSGITLSAKRFIVTR